MPSGKTRKATFKVQFVNSNNILTGARIKLDGGANHPNAGGHISVSFLNRKITVPKETAHLDLPFSEAEVLFVNLIKHNSLEFTFETTDPKKLPIRVYNCDVYTQHKDSMQFNML